MNFSDLPACAASAVFWIFVYNFGEADFRLGAWYFWYFFVIIIRVHHRLTIKFLAVDFLIYGGQSEFNGTNQIFIKHLLWDFPFVGSSFKLLLFIPTLLNLIFTFWVWFFKTAGVEIILLASFVLLV